MNFYFIPVEFIIVPRTRFELVHPCECHPLKMVRLPISPPGQGLTKKVNKFINLFVFCLCPRRDSNSQETILNGF